MIQRLLNMELNLNDCAIVTYLATFITVADFNMVIGAFVGIAGLGIQLYFKLAQDKREREKHEWEKNQNKEL